MLVLGLVYLRGMEGVHAGESGVEGKDGGKVEG